MDEFVDLSIQIEKDIAKYGRLLTQARHSENLRGPAGHEKLQTTTVIERVIDELKLLLRAQAQT